MPLSYACVLAISTLQGIKTCTFPRYVWKAVHAIAIYPLDAHIASPPGLVEVLI